MVDVKYVMHESPVWRQSQNYIAMVDLAPFGFPNLLEQLWLRDCGDGQYEVCCLPFRAYGIALGDRVVLDAIEGRYIKQVTGRSGRRLCRMFIAQQVTGHEFDTIRSRVESELARLQLLSEWSGDRHVAVDVPPESEIEPLLTKLAQEIADERVYLEWSDVEPFQV